MFFNWPGQACAPRKIRNQKISFDIVNLNEVWEYRKEICYKNLTSIKCITAKNLYFYSVGPGKLVQLEKSEKFWYSELRRGQVSLSTLKFLCYNINVFCSVFFIVLFFRSIFALSDLKSRLNVILMLWCIASPASIVSIWRDFCFIWSPRNRLWPHLCAQSVCKKGKKM